MGGSFASDRLAVLARTGQRFAFKPEMSRGEAIVFPTGRTPHSAFSLPANNLSKNLINLFHTLTSNSVMN